MPPARGCVRKQWTKSATGTNALRQGRKKTSRIKVFGRQRNTTTMSYRIPGAGDAQHAEVLAELRLLLRDELLDDLLLRVHEGDNEGNRELDD